MSMNFRKKFVIRKLLLCGRAWIECHYCGKHLSQKTMTLDHVNPSSMGGKNELSNFVGCCISCNQIKSNTPYSVFLQKVLRISA